MDEGDRYLCRAQPYLLGAVGHSRVKGQMSPGPWAVPFTPLSMGTSEDKDPVPARSSAYMTTVTEG